MLTAGRPFRGRELDELKEFLAGAGLRYEEGIEYSVCLKEGGVITGTGSVEANVIKCVAVEKSRQGQGIMAQIISELIQYLYEKERTHVFVYTRPENLEIFADMGFYAVYAAEGILLLENREKGFDSYLKQLEEETPKEALPQPAAGGDAGKKAAPLSRIGSVAVNCCPFTLGHRYLLEEALRQCDYLHLFLLSDNRGIFSARERYEMLQRGTEDLDRLILHETSGYIISAATFPTYFFKDRAQGESANCRLDLELFGARIAPRLGIAVRFVGTEPFCRITRAYNEEMKRILPGYGIRVVETKRKALNGRPVSASEVRKRIAQGDVEGVKKMVPEKVYRYLKEKMGEAVRL